MSELHKALEHVSSQVFTAHIRNQNIRLCSPYPDISSESTQLPVLEGQTTNWIEVENIYGEKVYVESNQQITFQVEKGKTDKGTVYVTSFDVVEKS